MVCRVIALCILTLGIELSAAHSAQLDPQQIKLISDTAGFDLQNGEGH
jgi:hypothetical protein